MSDSTESTPPAGPQRDGSADDARDRREFIRSAGRWVLGGAVAAFGTFLISRSARGEGECRTPSACRGCRQLKQCHLPAALVARARENGKES
jgi:hypothetical protein